MPTPVVFKVASLVVNKSMILPVIKQVLPTGNRISNYNTLSKTV